MEVDFIIKMTNIMEDVVKGKLMYILSSNDDFCKCDQCVSDVMCLAMNRLTPKYVNTIAGEVMVKMAKISAQDEIDIVNIIMECCILVQKSPRH